MVVVKFVLVVMSGKSSKIFLGLRVFVFLVMLLVVIVMGLNKEMKIFVVGNVGNILIKVIFIVKF